MPQDLTEHLRTALEVCLTGDGTFLAIRGPAGIGKSWLLEQLRAEAEEHGMLHLHATCHALTRSLPYAGVRDIFATLRAADAEDQVFAGAADLARHVLDSKPDESYSPAERAAALHGLTWLMTNVATRGPLLITIDDLHLADPETTDWLGYIQTRIQDLPLLIVVATRPVPPSDPVDAIISALPDTRVLEPQPLVKDQIASLASALQVSLTDSGLQRVHAVTGGVPFLVRAALQAAAESGHDDAVDLRGDGMQREVRTRLRATGPKAAYVAEAVAILGPDAQPAAVAELAQLSMEETLETIDQLRHGQLLMPGEPVRFVHGLVEDAVADAITPPRLHALHNAAADILAARGAAKEQIATHLLHTSPYGDPRHATWLAQAAHGAISRGAPTTGSTYLTRLLDEPLDATARAAALHELGTCELQLALPQATERLQEAVSTATSVQTRLDAAKDLVKAQILNGQTREAYTVLRDLVSTIGHNDPAGLAIEAETLALGLMNTATAAELDPMASELEARLTHDGSTTDRMVAGALAFNGFRTCAPYTDCQQLASYALSHIREAADLALSPTGVVAQLTLLHSGKPEEARRIAQFGEDLAAAAGTSSLYYACSYQEAAAAFFVGDLAAVKDYGTRVQTAFAEGMAPMLAVALALPLNIRGMVERGETEDANTTLAAIGMDTLPADQMLFSLPLLTRGILRLRNGDPAGAYEDLRACGDLQLATGHLNSESIPWRAALVETLDRLGRPEEATALAEEDLHMAQTYGAPTTVARALLSLARLRPTNAIDLAEEAAALLTNQPAALDRARAEILHGSLLRRAGHRSEARAPLRRGREQAQISGATPLVTWAETELKASGGRVLSRPVTGSAALTPSERRVAAYAAQGLSNSEIAQSLFISLKTVEMHLGRAYQKLGIGGRPELTETLLNHPHNN